MKHRGDITEVGMLNATTVSGSTAVRSAGPITGQSAAFSNTVTMNTLNAVSGAFTGSLSVTDTLTAATVTGTSTVRTAGVLSGQSLSISNTGTFSTVTGTTGQFGGSLSGQSGTFGPLTVSGSPALNSNSVINTANLANQAAAQVNIGSFGSSGSLSGSYSDLSSVTITTRAGERVLISGYVLVAPTGGTATFAIRRGSTVISAEVAFIVFSQVVAVAVDTPGAGTFTYHLSGKTDGTATWNTAQTTLVSAK